MRFACISTGATTRQWFAARPDNSVAMRKRARIFGAASLIAFLMPSLRIALHSFADVVLDASVIVELCTTDTLTSADLAFRKDGVSV